MLNGDNLSIFKKEVNIKLLLKTLNKNEETTILYETEDDYIPLIINDELIYDNKVLKMLKLYYYVDINTISDLNISEKTINDINDIISAYYDRFTGVYIHSKEFLKKLK